MRTLLLSLAAAAVAADGVLHGLWTDRWGNSPELEQAVARLRNVPLQVGEWRGQALTLRPREAEQAGFAGHLLRRYERPDGASVTVMLACGRPGPLSVHTPEVCYGGAGFALAGDAARYTPKVPLSAPAEFWKGKFTKEGAIVPEHLRVLWSWHAGGAWNASDRPRWDFAGLRVLHKLYVTCPMSGADDRQEDALCAEFLAAFLPELEKTLFARP